MVDLVSRISFYLSNEKTDLVTCGVLGSHDNTIQNIIYTSEKVENRARSKLFRRIMIIEFH